MKLLSIALVCGGLGLVGGIGFHPGEANAASGRIPAINRAVGIPRVVVNVTPNVVRILKEAEPAEETVTFSGGDASPTGIDVGDVVSVTIFEAGGGGLFLSADPANRAANFVNIPEQKVDREGNIAVPYAGTIEVKGKEPAEIQRLIEQRLASRAIEPQVVVMVKQQDASQVTVLGDVGAPSRFQISPKGEKLLDMVARAGGPKQPGYQTYVTLQRGGKNVTVYFPALMRDPANNASVQPGDTIYVSAEPRTFTVFGAAGTSGRFDFSDETITLSDALGQAGGVRTPRTNPAGPVFLYRFEDRAIAEEYGVRMQDWGDATQIPIVYRFDVRDPGGFFIASSFKVRDKDVIYVDSPQDNFLR